VHPTSNFGLTSHHRGLKIPLLALEPLLLGGTSTSRAATAALLTLELTSTVEWHCLMTKNSYLLPNIGVGRKFPNLF